MIENRTGALRDGEIREAPVFLKREAHFNQSLFSAQNRFARVFFVTLDL